MEGYLQILFLFQVTHINHHQIFAYLWKSIFHKKILSIDEEEYDFNEYVNKVLDDDQDIWHLDKVEETGEEEEEEKKTYFY